MAVFGDKRRFAALAGLSFLLVLAIALGRAIVESQTIDAPTAAVLLGALGALIAIGAMLIGPVVCLAAIPALSIVPFLPRLAVFPRIDVSAADAFFAALVVWVTAEILKTSRPARPRVQLRATPILIFMGFALLTIAYSAALDRGGNDQALVSWLRLAQTLSLAVLAAMVLRSTRDVKWVLAAVAIAGVVAVTIGSGADVAGTGGPYEEDDRAGGLVGPNTLGLISGVLVLMGFLGPLGPQLAYRVPLVVVGVTGLVTSASVGSLIATSVALILGLVLVRPRRSNVPGVRVLMAVVALGVGLGVAFAVTSLVRPANLPTSDSFMKVSAGHRVVVGAAGIELAARNPVIGVGWRRSSNPQVIGDPEIGRSLRARFPDAKREFFPDEQPASVHNAYIQLAAELGLVGLILLAVVLFTLGRDTRAVIARAPPGSEARRLLWFLAWSVVLILIWMNDNPLYGGQPETVLLSVFVGAIAAIGRLNAPAPGDPQDAGRPAATASS